jgi:hypothetical protein
MEIIIIYILSALISFFGGKLFLKSTKDWSNRSAVILIIISLLPVINWVSGLVIGFHFLALGWNSSYMNKFRDWWEADSKL